MAAQWERANPAEHDYDDRLLPDGYLKVYVHRTARFDCECCGFGYQHFFVAHADWRKVPLEHRSKRLCVDCYAKMTE